VEECVDFTAISLTPHASKILLNILTNRLDSEAESVLGKDQYGFRNRYDRLPEML